MAEEGEWGHGNKAYNKPVNFHLPLCLKNTGKYLLDFRTFFFNSEYLTISKQPRTTNISINNTHVLSLLLWAKQNKANKQNPKKMKRSFPKDNKTFLNSMKTRTEQKLVVLLGEKSFMKCWRS